MKASWTSGSASKAGGLQARLDHAQPAVREDRALERLIGLQPNDDFVVAINVARLVRQHRRRRLSVDSKNALLPFFLEIWLQLGPDSLGFR